MPITVDIKDVCTALRATSFFCRRLRRRLDTVGAITDDDVDALACYIFQATENLMNIDFKLDAIETRNKGEQRVQNSRR